MGKLKRYNCIQNSLVFPNLVVLTACEDWYRCLKIIISFSFVNVLYQNLLWETFHVVAFIGSIQSSRQANRVILNAHKKLGMIKCFFPHCIMFHFHYWLKFFLYIMSNKFQFGEVLPSLKLMLPEEVEVSLFQISFFSGYHFQPNWQSYFI